MIEPDDDYSSVYDLVDVLGRAYATASYDSTDGRILLSKYALHRSEISLIGVIHHETMHKILHRLIGLHECKMYDRIYWSVRIDHDICPDFKV